MRVREEGFILKKAALPNNLSLLLVLSWLQLQVTIRATMLLLFSLQQVYVISSEVGLSTNLESIWTHVWIQESLEKLVIGVRQSKM